MTLVGTLRGLLRRWYVVVPGLVLAVAAAVGCYLTVAPQYERTATQLLLPGKGTVPDTAQNPYLYLSGLTQAADVVVRVLASEEVAGAVSESYPGTTIEVQRDPTASGPVIQTVVTARTDADADAALEAMVSRTDTELARLQDEEKVAGDNRMTVTRLTFDATSTPKQRTRLVLTAGAGLGVGVLTLVAASIVDGLAGARGRRKA